MFGRSRNTEARTPLNTRTFHSNGTHSGPDTSLIPKNEEPFLFNLRALPRGVIVKRIFHRQGSEDMEWRVGFQHANGRRLRTEYYGQTVDIALAEFFKNHEDMLIVYNNNNARIT